MHFGLIIAEPFKRTPKEFVLYYNLFYWLSGIVSSKIDDLRTMFKSILLLFFGMQEKLVSLVFKLTAKAFPYFMAILN